MSEQRQREEAICNAARPLPALEREALLEKSCGDDLQLRQRIEALLNSHDSSSGILERRPLAPRQKGGALGTTRPASAVPSEMPGDRIGHYKLLQKLGEG